MDVNFKFLHVVYSDTIVRVGTCQPAEVFLPFFDETKSSHVVSISYNNLPFIVLFVTITNILY